MGSTGWHSAGASIATRYAARYPGQVSKLALITPSTRAVGLVASSEMRREVVSLRQAEPWFAGAAAAFDRIQAGSDTPENWDSVAPFFYGRWAAEAQAHSAANEEQVNEEAAGVFAGPRSTGRICQICAPCAVARNSGRNADRRGSDRS